MFAIVYTGMTGTNKQLTEKVREVVDELKLVSLWQAHQPHWVSHYNNSVNAEWNFCEWLQFIYLPNLLQQGGQQNFLKEQNLAPQAIRFCGDEMQKGKLLQLLVELDSLS